VRSTERLVHLPRSHPSLEAASIRKQEHRDLFTESCHEIRVGIDLDHAQPHAVAPGGASCEALEGKAGRAPGPGVQHGFALRRARAAHGLWPRTRSRAPARSPRSPTPAPTASLRTSLTSANRLGTNFWWISSRMA